MTENFSEFLVKQETPVDPDATVEIEIDRQAEIEKATELEKKERSNYEIVADSISKAPNIESIIDTLLDAPLPLKDEQGEEFDISRAAQVLSEIKHDLAFRKFNNESPETVNKTSPTIIQKIPPGLGLKERIEALYL